MRKSFLQIIIASIFIGLCSGCTQPDGNICDWFGSWYLEEILIDGKVDQDYLKDKETDEERQVLVSFQSNVFNMAYLNGNSIYGTWVYEGDLLTLDASYNSGGGYQDDGFDPFPKVLHFPKDLKQITLTVTQMSGKTMQWQLDSGSGAYLYNFRKYP